MFCLSTHIAGETFNMLYVPGTSPQEPLKKLWTLPCFHTSTLYLTE